MITESSETFNFQLSSETFNFQLSSESANFQLSSETFNFQSSFVIVLLSFLGWKVLVGYGVRWLL